MHLQKLFDQNISKEIGHEQNQRLFAANPSFCVRLTPLFCEVHKKIENSFLGETGMGPRFFLHVGVMEI